MCGRAISRGGLVLIGVLLGASGIAEAKIPPAATVIQPMVSIAPDGVETKALKECLAKSSIAEAPAVTTTKTITLNFGPLHFEEILKSTQKDCRS